MKTNKHSLRRFIHILIIFSAIMLTACRSDVADLSLSLIRCADMPVERASCASFVIDGKAYVFAGRDSVGRATDELWTYDPSSNAWQLCGETPMQARVKPTACVVGHDVFVGLGFNGRVNEDTCYLRDFWRYTPSNGQWQKLANYPCNKTNAAISMTDGEHIFVCYGICNSLERDIYVYDIAADTWEQMKDDTERSSLYPPRTLAACGAACQGRFFLGTGYHTHSRNFWVELLPFEDEIWNKRAPLPGKGRNSATCTASDNYIYVAGGRNYGGSVTDGFLHNDILRYSPADDKWEHCATLPDGPAENMISFCIEGHVYFGLGNDKNNRTLSSLYRLDEP